VMRPTSQPPQSKDPRSDRSTLASPGPRNAFCRYYLESKRQASGTRRCEQPHSANPAGVAPPSTLRIYQIRTKIENGLSLKQ